MKRYQFKYFQKEQSHPIYKTLKSLKINHKAFPNELIHIFSNFTYELQINVFLLNLNQFQIQHLYQTLKTPAL